MENIERKVARSSLFRLREWWRKEKEMTQDEVNDMVAIRLLNSIDIAARVREQEEMKDSAISAVAVEIGEDQERADKSRDHVEKIIVSARGKPIFHTEAKKEGAVSLSVTYASLKGLQELNKREIRLELARARARFKPVKARLDPPKKKRKPRYSFLAAKGVSKL